MFEFSNSELPARCQPSASGPLVNDLDLVQKKGKKLLFAGKKFIKHWMIVEQSILQQWEYHLRTRKGGGQG